MCTVNQEFIFNFLLKVKKLDVLETMFLYEEFFYMKNSSLLSN